MVILGDNAYANGNFMVSPYRGATAGINDDFNFFHSQLRITIERAFGMLVRRFSLLRRAMPASIPIRNKMAIVLAICKLHNYLMPSTGVPSEENMHKEIGKAAAKKGNNATDGLVNEEGLPDGLLGAGDQADDACDIDYANYERSYSKRHALRKQVLDSGKERPNINRRR